MKNKKVLNICLLSLSLLTLFTFILPISKFEFALEKIGFVAVMFYVLNSVLVLSMVALVVFALINLFQDNYKFVKIMEVCSIVGFLVVFICMLIFACAPYANIKIGYLLVCLESFACANFSQIARLVGYSSEMKNSLFEKDKTKTNSLNSNNVNTNN